MDSIPLQSVFVRTLDADYAADELQRQLDVELKDIAQKPQDVSQND